jgi:TetR/AcrR family transcriptional regulator, cholesterol catabolism regulator
MTELLVRSCSWASADRVTCRGSVKIDPMPTQQSKSERTRQRILDAAADVLAERGYGETRLSDIAERVGMQAGSLYYHFASRDELVAEILRIGIERSWDLVATAVGRLPSSATPIERLEAAIRAHTRSIVGQSSYASAHARTYGQVPTELAREHRKAMRAYGDYWHDLFGASQQAGEIDGDVDLFVTRMLAFGAMNWTSEWFRTADPEAVERLADQAVRLVLYGVISRPDAPAAASSRRHKSKASSRSAAGVV